MQDNGASSYRRYLQGDPHALEELVRAYSDGLTQYAYLYVRDYATAEDVMEESFAALIVKRKQLPDTLHFKAYLYKIARNKCLDLLRSKRRKELPLSGYAESLVHTDTERKIADRMRDRKVYQCLQKLPQNYRDVLYFSYFDGYKIAEICEMTGKSRKKVYNLLARAKAALKEILLKEGIGYDDL